MKEENSLPRGWIWTKLGEVVALNPRTSLENLDDESLVSFVGMASVEAESGKMDASQTRALKDVRRGYTGFKEGDVLFAKITPCMENGKTARNLVSGVGFGSTEFHVLRAETGICGDLIWYFVGQKTFRRDARANMTGSAGQLRVPTNFLQNFPFPLAPLEEQKRIALQLDTLFSEVDAGMAAITRARVKVKSFRASLLRAATSGELSAQWREQNAASETGAALLQRILDERRAAWEAKERAKRAANSPAKKLFEDESWKQNYAPPKAPDTSNLPQLPENWCWASVEQVSNVVRGASPRPAGDPKYFGGSIPWITVGSITADDETYLTQTRDFVTEEGCKASRFIEPDTLLLTNSGATLGVPKITSIGGCINDGSVALLDVNYPLKLYLVFLLKSLTQKLRNINQGAAQPNLNTTIVKEIYVPLPPLAEQEWVVGEVERRLSLVSEVEKTLGAAHKRAQSLKAAILARAFRGELCEQNPNDESAEVLLKRIRETRKDAPKRTKRGKTEQGRLF